MKKTMKKFPLLICLIMSFAIVVASLFVAGFCGIKIAPSLGGGSQFEVAIPDNVDSKICVKAIKEALAENELSLDSVSVEEKFLAINNVGGYSKRYVVVKVAEEDISDAVELKVREEVALGINVPESHVSGIDNIVSSIKSSDILYLGLAVGIVAVCLFVFGWIRYDLFAALSFLLSYLHNIILFLSIVIITRIPLGLVSIAGIMILTLVMTALIISIYEKNKVESEMHLGEKETVSQRMIRSEAYAMKPYIFIGATAFIVAALLLLVPVMSVVYSSVSLIIALAVSAYTALLVGPGVYSAFLEIQAANMDARLSRNDEVNKAIRKKVAKSKKENSKAEKEENLEKIESKKTTAKKTANKKK